MKDLDWGDVVADANRMKEEYEHALWLDLDRRSDLELQTLRYTLGAQAREGNTFSIAPYVMVDMILLHRHTSLCEGCLGRGGCEMCNPSMDDYLRWEQDSYSREAEEDMLGRPLFPNEY